MAGVGSLSADQSVLADDERFDVISFLTPLVHKWRQIGNALRLPSATLDGLKDAYQGQPEAILDAMVCKWLALAYDFEKFGKPSWDMLVKAIASPAGGDNRRLAEDIAKAHPFIDTSEPSPPPVPVRLGSTGSATSQSPMDSITYAKAIPELHQYDWFHGKLTRAECDVKMLTFPDNCFLLRESATRQGQLTLSLKNSQGVQHFIIKRGVDCYEVDGTFRQFGSMPELIKHYEGHTLTKNEEDKLLTPCPQ